MLKETDIRFGTWNVKSLYRAGSLMIVAKEIGKIGWGVVRTGLIWLGIGTSGGLL
jgi:hypothetical protein